MGGELLKKPLESNPIPLDMKPKLHDTKTKEVYQHSEEHKGEPRQVAVASVTNKKFEVIEGQKMISPTSEDGKLLNEEIKINHDEPTKIPSSKSILEKPVNIAP